MEIVWLILIDFIPVWFILNAVSDKNWDGRFGAVLVITAMIAILANLAAGYAIEEVGLGLGIVAYLATGTAIFWLAAQLKVAKAVLAMAALFGIKVAVVYILHITDLHDVTIHM